MRTIYRNNREGMALAMSIFAIVVIGALIAGAFFASNQDFKIGRNSLVAQRAFTAAEFGLNQTMGGWDQKLNLAIPVGKDTTFAYVTGDGGTTNVRVTRLNDYSYWFVSEGIAGANTPVETRRRTSAVMRLAYPAVKVGGALTLAGGGYVKGSAVVSGKNVDPPGWQCADYPGRDTTAVSYAPGTTVTVQKTQNVIGNPATYADSNAGSSGTYVKYGDETWTSLVQNADITINSDLDPLPVGTATTCNIASPNNLTNWGEPIHDGTGVVGCQTYFPIIHVTTDFHVNNGRGQGILLIDGSLQVNGNFQFNGLIIIRDKIMRGNGNPMITGAVMAANAAINETNADGSAILGNADFQYSKCALETALRGSARLVPAKRRAWAEMW